MTKGIGLTQGKVAVVDDDMQDELNQYNWFAKKDRNTWYATRNDRIDGKKTSISMHRQILGLERGDGKIADHVNRNGLDNRRSNLRIVSPTENNRNHGGHKHNTSGHNGVSWNNNHQRWEAYLQTDGKRIHLGDYKNKVDAVEARRLGVIEHWGEELVT